MSSIPPSPPPTGAAPTLPPAASTATVISTDNASQLAALTPSTVIDASASATAVRGQIQLQTDSGTMVVKLPMTVPEGASLQLQMTSQGANPQFRVLSVNGQPVALNGQLIGGAAVAGAATLPPRLASGAAFLATPAAGGSAGSGGAGLSMANAAGNALQGKAANLLTAAGPLAPNLGGAATMATGISATLIHAGGAGLPSGATFTVRIAAIQLPADIATGGNPTASAGTPGSTADAGPNLATAQLGRQAYGASAPPLSAGPPLPTATPPAAPSATAPTANPATPDATATPQPPGGEGAASDNSGEKPAEQFPSGPDSASGSSASSSSGTSAPPPSAASASESALPRMLTAVVAPNSNAGRPLLQTELGLVALDTAIELPAGSRVELQTVGAPTLPPSLPPTDKPPAATPQTNWPALDEAMETLRQTDPAAAQQLTQRLPEIGPRLGPTLIAMTAAIQSGNVRGWLGEGPSKALERAGRKDLLSSIKSDLGGMTSAASLPAAGGEWMSMMVPMMFGSEIERIRMTVRRPPDDEETADAREDEGTRFLVDVDMSRLGALQLDGLVKRKSKRFDLIVRSQKPLGDELRREISAIFGRSLEGLNMVGGATFLQGTPFVQPIPAAFAVRSGMMI